MLCHAHENPDSPIGPDRQAAEDPTMPRHRPLRHPRAPAVRVRGVGLDAQTRHRLPARALEHTDCLGGRRALEPQPDRLLDHAGHWLLTVPCADPRDLVMDILRHVPDVEVIAPDELREEVVRRMREGLRGMGGVDE